MAKTFPSFIVLAISAILFANIPGTCLAQPADNSELNKKENMSLEQLTAGQQGETKEDREITQKIRRAVVKDKTLSTSAHNVKIITVGGVVTLKGPVRSEKEKKIIEEKAAGIAGKDNIRSEIGIAPKKKEK